jgi:hypothetical protein
MDSTTAMGAWVGWWRARPGCTWTRLVAGDTYDDTLALLLDALAPVRGGDSVILPAGRHPDRQLQPMGRRRS